MTFQYRPARVRWRISLRCSCGTVVGGATGKTRTQALARYDRNRPVTDARARAHRARRKTRHELGIVIRSAAECRICGFMTPWLIWDEIDHHAMDALVAHDCGRHLEAILALSEQPFAGLDERGRS